MKEKDNTEKLNTEADGLQAEDVSQSANSTQAEDVPARGTAGQAKHRWSRKKWIAAAALLFAVLLLVPVVNELIPQKVNVKYISFDGETTKSYWTRAHKVSEFAAEHKDEIAQADVITGLVNASTLDISPKDIFQNMKALISGDGNVVLAATSTGDDAKSDTDTESDGDAKSGTDTESDDDAKSGTDTESDAIVPKTEAASGKATASEVTDGGSQDSFIKNGMTITVIKAAESKAKIGGSKERINIYPGTVNDTLDYNKIDFDEDDVIKPALDEELQSDDIIKITRVQIKTKKKTLDIEPQEKDAVFDSSLASGTIVRSEGKPGQAIFTYTYKYVNGKKVRTQKKFTKWKKKPVDIQLRFGTSVTGEDSPVRYSETFIGNCTAYYAGNNAHGATGQRCYYGTCAVDPSVIPYGTKLYVEGYGTAIANDCGGAVKGHIIDLYMRSTKECFQWGRRNRKVYVLN